MRVAAAMMVKNEADIIERTVRNLFRQGVERVYVADNLSTDRTGQILEGLTGEFLGLALSSDTEVGYWQSSKMTGYAQQAYVDGFDWLVPCDADELWRGRGRTVAEVLEAARPEEGRSEALLFNHYATAYDPADPDPVVRLRWRTREPLGLPKMAVRLGPGVVILPGNHNAVPPAFAPLVQHGGLEVRHYPYRSAEQFVAKAVQGKKAYDATDLPRGLGLHWREYGEMIEEHGEQAGIDWFNHYFRYDHPDLAGTQWDQQAERGLAALQLDPFL